jgi:hypothetical protein
MKVEIHYTIDGFADCYVLTGNTVEEIQEKNEIEMERRNLDSEKNNCWSKEIKQG